MSCIVCDKETGDEGVTTHLGFVCVDCLDDFGKAHPEIWNPPPSDTI